MTFCRLIIAIAIALSARAALAQEPAKPLPFDPAAYPSEVQKALHEANEECTAQGGGEVTFAPNTVQKIDLTGDGRDDYIIGFGDTQCAGLHGVYCGSGGCLMDVLVTLPGGRIRRVFQDYVRSYQILPDPAEKPHGPRRIGFVLHGSYCGGHGSPSCLKEQAITAKPFVFKAPK